MAFLNVVDSLNGQLESPSIVEPYRRCSASSLIITIGCLLTGGLDSTLNSEILYSLLRL